MKKKIEIAWQGVVFAIPMAWLTACFAQMVPAIHAESVLLYRWPWVESLGVELAFRLDGLSLLFALLISGIGTLVMLYAARYMVGYPQKGWFFTILFAFALSMLGLVLADDAIVMFIFWELTTITSFLLIGYRHEDEHCRKSAEQALLVTGMAGLVMLAGLLMFGEVAGSLRITDMLAAGDALQESPLFTAILLTIIIGAFAKSAQWPLHFWLPNAMAAPTPVSAYLHSATMVKAGIYLLARFQPVLSAHEYWFWLLAVAGSITAVWSALWSLKQYDLKQMFAYTTVTALGTLTLLLAVPHPMMALAAMLFLVVHALYKATLFMVVGIIDKKTHTRDRRELAGLGRKMPVVMVIALAAGLSMAGLPLLIGFVGKETMYSATLETADYALLLALVFANALMVATAAIAALRPFLGQPSEAAANASTPHWLLYAPPLILAVLGIIWGIAPEMLGAILLVPAADNISGHPVATHLSAWHGFGLPLAMSALTLGLGLLIFLKCDRITARLEAWHLKLLTAERIYNLTLVALPHYGHRITRCLQSGSLNCYLRINLLTIASLMLLVLVLTEQTHLIFPVWPQLVDWVGIGVGLLIFAGSITAIRATSKIMGLAALGATGYAVAGIFLLYGALDVAMTQLLVETLLVVLAAAVLWRIPDFSISQTWDERWRPLDLCIAAATGVAVTFALFSVITRPLDLSLTYFFENASYALAHGQNIVNVILVDFRALDTLGETTVVATASFGVWVLTKGLRRETRA